MNSSPTTTSGSLDAIGPPGGQHQVLDAALAYAAQNWPVFPCGVTKKPLVAGGFLAATTDNDQVRDWWTRWPDAGIGVPTGPTSGFWVLDIDKPKKDGSQDGQESLAALEREHGALFVTVEQVTGGGGRHLFFAWPEDGMEVRNSVGKLGPGLDVRGDGGYVIMPPSLHQSGNRYSWLEGRTPEELPLAEAPQWLLEMVRATSSETSPQPPAGPVSQIARATSYGQRALADELAKLSSVAEGQRNDRLNAAAFRLGQLVAGGELNRPQVEAALLGAARGLGLPEPEVLGTIKSGLEAGLESPRSAPAPTARSDRRAGGAEQEEWHPELRKWPRLQQEALYGLAGDFVSLACHNSEADPAAVLATFLARFGIEVGPSPHVLVGDAKHPPRLFTVVIGASSKARKGTSGHPVERVFSFNQSSQSSVYSHVPAHKSPGPLSSGEGLVWRVRDPIELWQVDRKTGEGKWVTADPGEENKRLFVLDEELAAALQCTKREGNTLSTIIRTLWDSGNVEPLTKTSRAKTTGAHIGLVTHVTAAELARLLDETEALNGFANRFLWVCARRRKLVPFPQPMPQIAVEDLQCRILAALEDGRTRGRMDFDQEARALWLKAYAELSQDHPGLAGTVINRGEAQALRLALIYALLDSATEIRVEHLRSALAMWGYCRESALFVFGKVEADPLARRVCDALKGGPLTGTELHQALGGHVSKARLEVALNDLVAANRVGSMTGPAAGGRGGRPRMTFFTCEETEVCEDCSPQASQPEQSSQSTENSQMNFGDDRPWDGPSEVVL